MIVANHKYMLLACNLKEKCAPKFDMHGAERERERERERFSLSPPLSLSLSV
jgi:hypothetical protein